MSKLKNFKHLASLIIMSLLLFCFAVAANASALGDIDGDGAVSPSDARLALRASVGLENYADGSAQFKAADVDGSGDISASDARTILRVSVGLETLKDPEPAHTHTFGAWTAEKNGNTCTGRHFRTCSGCGQKEYASCTYGAYKEISPATCTEGQLLAQVCSVCGSTSKTKAGTAKLGHIQGQIISETKATCESSGKLTYKCTRCNKTYSEYPSALGHDYTKKDDKHVKSAPTCTANGVYYYSCTRCGKSSLNLKVPTYYTKANSALGHCYNIETSILGSNIPTFYCTRCGLFKKTADVADFNSLVNRLKCTELLKYTYTDHIAYAHPVAKVSASTMSSICDNYNFGLYTHTNFIKDLFEEEMNSSNVTYTPLVTTYAGTLPVTGVNQKVSLLENGDAKITAEILNGLDMKTVFTDKIPNTYNTSKTSQKVYDVTPYKSKTFSGKILKLTAEVGNENYFTDSKNHIPVLSEGEMFKLQKISNIDLKGELSAFPGDNYTMVEAEEGFSMTMTLKQVSTSGKATFWFDATTLEPIAAAYATSLTMEQDIYINFIGILEGTMSPVVTTNDYTVYVFTDCFE